MIIYISSDMEGSTGVASPRQVDATRPEYAFGKAMQEADVRVAVKAALDAGASRVVVNDAHGDMTNVDVSIFGDEARLITGSPKLLGMTEGATGAAGAIFLGYHAMAGTEKAVLDHTFAPDAVYALSINGRKMGECGVNALLCGALDVPVIMASGCDALCFEAASLLGEKIVTCSVKEGLGGASAFCLSPKESAEAIYYAVKSAVERLKKEKIPPFKPKPPYIVDIALINTIQTDSASLVPGAVRTGARELRFETEDALETRRVIYSVIECARAVNR